MTTHNTNVACCNLPPIQHDYTPKGKFESIGDFKKVYVTGPESENLLVAVFDIFGFFPQTQQAADILGDLLKTKVLMPDFFEPDEPFPIEPFPPTTDEGKQALQNFFGTTANPPENAKKLTKFGNVLKKEKGAKKIGVYGYCWGGKVVILSSGENTPFDTAAILHPALLAVDDAEKMTIPLAIYPSRDEPAEEVTKLLRVIAKKPFATLCDNKTYMTMHHGWAAARGNLKNEDNVKEYEDVYNRLVAYFKKTGL